METKWKSEAQFQAECNRWFCRTYPEQRGRLMLLYNNPPNAIIGPKLITMGMQKGASDFIYLIPVTVAFIELKIGYRPQSPDQKVFQAMVESIGFGYYLVREELEVFQQTIRLLNL